MDRKEGGTPGESEKIDFNGDSENQPIGTSLKGKNIDGVVIEVRGKRAPMYRGRREPWRSSVSLLTTAVPT